MQRVLLWVLLLVVGTAIGAPVPFPKPARLDQRNDQDELQGEWELVFLSGFVDPGVKLQFSGKRWTWTDDRPREHSARMDGTFELARDGKRKGIILRGGPGMIVVSEWTCVYKLAGDLLTIVEVKDPPDPTRTMVFRRLSRPDKSTKRLAAVR
jgi:hypothetical protein